MIERNCVPIMSMIFISCIDFVFHACMCHNPSLSSNHSWILRSIQSIVHSRFPSKLLNHSIPSPVHSPPIARRSASPDSTTAGDLSLSICSHTGAPSRAMVSAAAAAAVVDASSRSTRGANQSLLVKSKKQRSDQLHEVKKRTRRRSEQYTHGRLRK